MKYSTSLARALVLLGSSFVSVGALADAGATRREALYDKLGDGVAVVIAAPELFTAWRAHRYDPSYFAQEFKQEVIFFYLTGIEEAGAALLLDGKTRRSTLYLRQDPAIDKLPAAIPGFTAVKPRGALVADIESIAERRPTVFLLLGEGDAPIESGRIVASQSPFPEGLGAPKDNQEQLQDALQAHFPWMQFRNLDPVLATVRAVKDEEEIRTMTAAAQMSAHAMLENIRSMRPGVSEGELDGVSRFVCRREGAQRIPYSEDIQSGPNQLMSYWKFFDNYHKHDRQVRAGEMALIDTACEYNYYQSDMARTVPVSGSFTPAQRAAYDLYLRGYKAALAAIRPGATQRDISLALVGEFREARRSLKDTSLIQAADDIIARYESGVPLGHFVDLYVYGAGDTDKPLVPGQILTIEPAMVVQGLATRIVVEDLILVTAQGHEILTDLVPREPEALTRLMKEEGILTFFNKSRPAPVVTVAVPSRQ